MARPVSGKYRIGARCERCGDNRKHRNGACVTCTKKANADKYQRNRGSVEIKMREHRGHERLTLERIAELVTNDAHSVSASARSRYLDSITRKHFGLAVEDDEQRVTCFGDARRLEMQVGPKLRPVSNYNEQQKTNHAQNDDVQAAIKLILHRLPDLVTIGEMLAALPPRVLEPINETRRPMAIAIALKALGVRPVRRTTPVNGGQRIYVVRHPRRYGGMSAVAIFRAKKALDAGTAMPAVRPSDRQQKAIGRQDHRRETESHRPPSLWLKAHCWQ